MATDTIELIVTSPGGPWSQTGAELYMQPPDPDYINIFPITGDTLVVAHNTSGATAPLSIRFSSEPDSAGTFRTGDIDQELAAGEFRVFRFVPRGWANSEGYVEMPSGQSDEIYVGIVALQ